MLALIAICSVEPTEVWVKLSYKNLTELVDTPMNGEGGYTVACHNKTVVSSRGRLSLKDSNGVSINRADYDLGYQTDELYSYCLNEVIHIVAVAHAEQSLLNKVSYCTYYAHRDQEFICRPGESLTPTTKFVVSTLFDEPGESVYVWVIYFDDSYLEYTIRDLLEENHELPLVLRENCSCSDPSNCLQQDDEPNGKVRVQCDSGTSYLYDIRSEFSYDLPPNVKQVATSRNLIVAVQPAEGQYQDDLVVTNMVTNSSHAAAQPLPGVYANSSNPATIRDVIIVPVNESEFCFFMRSNEISYFEVFDLGTLPVIESRSLPFHSDLTPIAFKDMYESSVIVVATNSNGTLVLVTIEVVQLGDTNTTGVNDTSGSNCTSLLPSNLTASPVPPTRRPTRPRISDRPTDDHDPTKSTSSDSSSNNFGSTYYIYGIVTGLLLEAGVIVVVLLVWRLRQHLRKRRKYDINNPDPS